jgi:glycosyltransferase involved in cell wall biosynthesis
MRVVQFCESFSPFSQTFIYDLVLELQRQNVDTRVLTLGRIDADKRPFPCVYLAPKPWRWNPFRLALRLTVPLGLTTREIHTYPLIRKHLYRQLAAIQPDIVHAQFGPMGILMAPIARSLNIPLLITFHGYDVNELMRQHKIRQLYQAFFSTQAKGICVSENLRSKLTKVINQSDRLHVLYNGVNVERFAYSDPAERYDGRTVRLLFVGRLVAMKSPMKLVQSFERARALLASSPIDLKLTIAGEGEEREAICEYIQKQALWPHVDMIGSVHHTRVTELMGSHHIYVQHNIRAADNNEEGFGVIFIEAHASGLPIIATASGGIPEVVVSGQTGYLVEPGDIGAMAECIANLAQSPSRWTAMGTAGRRRIEKLFNQPRQVMRLREIYAACLKKI